jgi:hypothetical protein
MVCAERTLSARVVPPRLELMQRSARAFVVLVVLGASCTGGQTGDEGALGGGQCPAPANTAFIGVGCVPNEPPAVQTTGVCTINSAEPWSGEYLALQGDGAGTCHVVVTFASGAKSSIDVKFVSMWRALGDDPHGCGQAFFPVDESGRICSPSGCKFSLPDPECDDAGTEDDAGE